MEKITIFGNIGGDPETKTNQRTGSEFFEMSVACSRKKQDSPDYHTTWYKVLFNQKSLLPYLKKGGKVIIGGTFRIDEWTDREGGKRFTLIVNADYITLAGSAEATPAPQAEAAPAQSNPAPTQAQTAATQPTRRPTPQMASPRPGTTPTPIAQQFTGDPFDGSGDNDLPF